MVTYEDILVGYFTLHRHKMKNEGLFNGDTNVILSLDRLAISSDFQGKGLGTYLVNKIKEIAYMTNEMYIQTFAIFDRWEWYQELGFRYIFEHELDPEKTDGLVYMILELLDPKLIEEYLDI